jgi:hypothetical protein
MKNMHFLFCFFVSSITLHSMDLGTAAARSENPEDNQKIILQNDFKKNLKNRFQDYKKKSFSINDMKNIQAEYYNTTNNESIGFLGECLHRDVCDEHGNTFVHLGILDKHLSLIEWAIGCMKRPLSTQNESGKEPIDLCIDQLMPDALDSNREKVDTIFTALAHGYIKIGFDYDHRRNFLKKIVALWSEHIKHDSTKFCLKEDILQGFAGQDIQLSEIYQEVCDKEGNTLTHILVSRHLADLLYNFSIKDYLTFATNKKNEDPVTLAQKNFLKVSRDLLKQCAPNQNFDIKAIPQEDINKKCCYYMLLNLQKKQANNTDFEQCCDKHIIEKN